MTDRVSRTSGAQPPRPQTSTRTEKAPTPVVITASTVVDAITTTGTQRANKLEDLIGIGPVFASALRAEGIKNTTDLFEATRTHAQREKLVTAMASLDGTRVPASKLLDWAHQVELMRLDGVGPRNANLLSQAGVATVKDLATRNPDNLRNAILATSDDSAHHNVPSAESLAKWIGVARVFTSLVED